MKPPKEFKIPESILKQLNELTGGGFVLFALDEKLSPVIYQKYDNDVVCIGLQKFIQMWSQTMEEYNQAIVDSSIGIDFGDDPELED